MTPGLSAGAPPEIKGQVDAAVAEARSAVARVAGRCPSRALELRRRAILARLAGGDIRVSDLAALRSISAQQAALNARVGNGKFDNGGPFDVLKAFAGGVKDAGADVAGAIGDNAGEVGHGVLDLAGLIPLFGEPADGINALIYAAEGDKTNAALSAAGMIPLLGWGATGGKIGRKIKVASDTNRDKVPAPPWTRRKDAYHHTTSDDVAQAIAKTGLRPGSYVTNKIYSPGDATVRLALPARNANPSAVVHVDLAAMRRDGIDVPRFTRVKRANDQSGGGLEIKFDKPIDEKYVTVVRRKP